jgi:hypothetical protein
MAKTKLFIFNIKNLKFATKTLGVWGTPADLAYARSLALEADYSETVLYGDGQKLAVLANDKGKTGTLGVTTIEEAYETACGRGMVVVGGYADIQQRSTFEHAIYYEVDGNLDGVPITIKNWLFNVVTGKPSKSYAQTEDDPTVNGYEYPLTVLGTNLRNSGDTADYTDSNGNTIKVYEVSAMPDDTGYATFGATVPAVKVPA